MGGVAALGDHRSHDRTLYDQAQFLRDDIWIPGSAFHNQCPEPANYLVPVRTGDILYPGTILFMLRYGIDEYAAEEIFLLEPFLQQIKQGQNALKMESWYENVAATADSGGPGR
jgi:hypothetical protein